MLSVCWEHYRPSGAMKMPKRCIARIGAGGKIGKSVLVYHLTQQPGMERIWKPIIRRIPMVEHALEIARQLEERAKFQSLNNLGICIQIKEYSHGGNVERSSYRLPIWWKRWSRFWNDGRSYSAEEYPYASQVFSQDSALIKDTEYRFFARRNADGCLGIMNGMKDKSIAITLVNLLADHPEASAEIKTRAARLREALIAENIQPESRNWIWSNAPHRGDVYLFSNKRTNPNKNKMGGKPPIFMITDQSTSCFNFSQEVLSFLLLF